MQKNDEVGDKHTNSKVPRGGYDKSEEGEHRDRLVSVQRGVRAHIARTHMQTALELIMMTV